MITLLPLPEDATAAQEMRFRFDNGDLQAVRSVMEKFGFVDEQAMLRFALVVLLKTESNGVYVDQGNERVFVSPSPSVLNQR